MKRYRFQYDPVVWLIFAAVVAVPSVELVRLRRAREAARLSAALEPRVTPAGHPRAETPATPLASPTVVVRVTPESASVTVPAIREAPPFLTTDSTEMPIVAFALSRKGDLAAVLEQSGLVTIWNVDLRKQVNSFATGIEFPASSFWPPASMALTSRLESGPVSHPPLLAIVGTDGRVHVWDASRGRKLFAAPRDVGGPRVSEVAWSGVVMVTTVQSDGTLANWMVTQPAGSEPDSRPSPGGLVQDVDANTDHGLVAAASTAGLFLLTIPGGGWKLVDTSSTHAPYTTPARFPRNVLLSPDGRFLATVWNNGDLRIYSTATRDLVRSSGYGAAPWLLAFSRDGNLLAVGGQGPHIQVWPTSPSADPIPVKTPRGRPLRAMWFAPHRRSLAVLEDGDRWLREVEVP